MNATKVQSRFKRDQFGVSSNGNTLVLPCDSLVELHDTSGEKLWPDVYVPARWDSLLESIAR